MSFYKKQSGLLAQALPPAGGSKEDNRHKYDNVMRKILSILMMAMMPLLFAACDGGDDYYDPPGWRPGGGGNDGALNEYEKNLVGSYVSDDDPSKPFYLVLRDDRTGSFKSVNNGQTTGDDFTWRANSKRLTVVYKSDGSKGEMEYYYADNHLYVDGIPLVANNGQAPDDTGNPLVGQWEGAINGYYQAVLGQTGDNYATVCEFASNGEGTQLDYNIYSPRDNYAYSPFTWTQTGGVIVVNYVADADGDSLPRAVFNNYALTDTRFTGTVLYGTQQFGFAYTATSGFDWTPYINGTRGAPMAAKTRMADLRKARSGPVRKGSFAR